MHNIILSIVCVISLVLVRCDQSIEASSPSSDLSSPRVEQTIEIATNCSELTLSLCGQTVNQSCVWCTASVPQCVPSAPIAGNCANLPTTPSPVPAATPTATQALSCTAAQNVSMCNATECFWCQDLGACTDDIAACCNVFKSQPTCKSPCSWCANSTTCMPTTTVKALGNKCTTDPLWPVGVTLAILAGISISTGMAVQKECHNKLKARPEASYLKEKLWWIGMGLISLGEAGNFLAYGFAPATKVTPVGGVAVLSNVFVAHYRLHEPISVRTIVGAVVALTGVALVAIYGPQASAKPSLDRILQSYLPNPVIVGYLMFVIFCVAILFRLPERYRENHLLCSIFICGFCGSVTVLTTKGLSTAFIDTLKGDMQLQHWFFYVLLVTVVCTLLIQIRFFNVCISYFGAAEVVPVYFVVFTMASVVSSLVLFQELSDTTEEFVLFGIGVALTCIGVIVISSGAATKAALNDGQEPSSKRNTVARASRMSAMSNASVHVSAARNVAALGAPLLEEHEEQNVISL